MENINNFLKKLGLTKEIGQKIFSEVNIINLSPGERINEFGEDIPGIFFIKEGVLRSLYTSKSKEVITLKKYHSGDICGTIQFYNLPKNFCLSASTKVKGYLLKNDLIIDLLKNNANLKPKSQAITPFV